MIGAGLSNMAAAVYLIQEGNWKGSKLLFMPLITMVLTMVLQLTQ